MATTKEDVIEFISNMSVLELSELVKEFEEKFGVSAQATVVAGGGAAEAGAARSRRKSTQIKNAQNTMKGIGLGNPECSITPYDNFVLVRTPFMNFINGETKRASYSMKKSVAISLKDDGTLSFEMTINTEEFTVENVELFNIAKERLTAIWSVATL